MGARKGVDVLADSDSYCIGDLSPRRWKSLREEAGEQYSELQRLAVESLVHSGFEGYREFVRKEHVREFLSDAEKSAILSRVRRADEDREARRRSRRESALPASTYFPDQSDIEPPLLDLGWPDVNEVYRGVSRVDVCFEPFLGAGLGSCRHEIRKLIRSAKSVIAVAMDVFTDPDIFKDMLDASISRRVPVYLVLDERSAHLFGNICQDFGFTPNNLTNMRIRTVPGLTYCTRSGMKILGCVQEKYMLVDCNKVATGTYSYTWSDAKLHRSSITLLSGSVTEAYDKAFCILYAHSQPFSIDCSATIQQCAVPASPKHILPSQEPSKLEHTADNGKSAPLCCDCTGLKKVDHCVVEIGTQTDSCPTSHKETGKMTGMPSRRSGTRRSSIALKQQQQPVGGANVGNGVPRRRSSLWRSTNAMTGRIAKKRRTIEQSHKGQTKKVTSQAPPPGSPEDASSKKGDLTNVLPVSDLQQQGTKDAACSPFVGTQLNGGNSGRPRRGIATRPLNGAPLQQFMQRVWTERQASYNKVRSQLNGFLSQPLDRAVVGMRMRNGLGTPARQLASRTGVHMRPALPSSHMPLVNNFGKCLETRFGKENKEIQLRERFRVSRLVKK